MIRCPLLNSFLFSERVYFEFNRNFSSVLGNLGAFRYGWIQFPASPCSWLWWLETVGLWSSATSLTFLGLEAPVSFLLDCNLSVFFFFPPTDLWEYYLPYLYSCISLFGVLLLLCKFSVLSCLLLQSLEQRRNVFIICCIVLWIVNTGNWFCNILHVLCCRSIMVSQSKGLQLVSWYPVQ